MLRALALVVLQHTSGRMEQTCPLDGTTFTAVVDFSGTSFGQELDLRPIGPTAAPWAIPLCPRDNFPLYQEKFSEEELKDLRAYVATAEYRALKGETSYFLVGRLLQHRREPHARIGWAFLQATWQVSAEPAKYRVYATEALAEYKLALKDAAPHSEKWMTAELVCLELERRLQRWSDAQERLTRLQHDPEFPTDGAAFLKRQAQLLPKHDAKPHSLEPDERAK